MSHRSVHGSFEFVLADPEPRLRGRVRGYQGFWETRAAAAARGARRQLPLDSA